MRYAKESLVRRRFEHQKLAGFLETRQFLAGFQTTRQKLRI